MNKLSCFLTDISTAVLTLFNLDIFIERDAPNRSLLDFAREVHGTEQEFWGLGLHVIVGPLRVSPQ